MEKSRRLIFKAKTFEGFNEDYPELPQIPGIVEMDGYLLALPAPLEVRGLDGFYRAEALERLEGMVSVFHIVVNGEDYEYSLYQFLNSGMFVIPQEIKVLVVYHDHELAVYTTLALKVRLVKQEAAQCTPNRFGSENNYVLQFHDFNCGFKQKG